MIVKGLNIWIFEGKMPAVDIVIHRQHYLLSSEASIDKGLRVIEVVILCELEKFKSK